MFYIQHCKSGEILDQTNDKEKAVKMASELIDPTDTFDTYITDTSRGYSRIIGFGSTGLIEETGDQTDPCTRGGSILFGRETE